MKDRIKNIRKELGLTQQEFSGKLGIARNNVAGYEAGNRNPSDAVISLICTKFNVREAWLREGTGEMFRASPRTVLDSLAAEYNLDQGSYIAIEKFLKLKPELRSGLIEYFKEVTTSIQNAESEAVVPSENTSNIPAAEAAYEKSLGIAPARESTASNTTSGTDQKTG